MKFKSPNAAEKYYMRNHATHNEDESGASRFIENNEKNIRPEKQRTAEGHAKYHLGDAKRSKGKKHYQSKMKALQLKKK